MNESILNDGSKRAMLVACDDGFAETKVVLEDGRKFRFPSMVRRGGMRGVPNDEIHVYEADGPNDVASLYTATGDFDIDAGSTRFDGYPFSAENRVMIHHALRRSGLGGKSIQLATSLPVADYFDGDNVALRTIGLKSTNIMRPVRSVSGAACAEIAGSKVYAEGVAAWVDFAVSDAGDFQVKLKRSAAVIDIGGRTTDTVKVLKQLSVEKANSGTCLVGVLNIYDEVAQAIARHPEILEAFPGLKSTAISRSVVVEVVATGRYIDSGLNVDLAAEVNSAKESVWEKIMRDVEARIASGFDLEVLLFVGGGGSVLRDQIQAKYKRAEFSEEPEFANARGMLKMMKFV